jgi:hypothetical protein
VPTALNATGGLPEGTYIEYYGNYLEDNFSSFKSSQAAYFPALTCPPFSDIGPLPPVPPTSLTIPDISSYPTGSNLFLSVVEEALPGTCPGVWALSTATGFLLTQYVDRVSRSLPNTNSPRCLSWLSRSLIAGKSEWAVYLRYQTRFL